MSRSNIGKCRKSFWREQPLEKGNRSIVASLHTEYFIITAAMQSRDLLDSGMTSLQLHVNCAIIVE